MTNGPLIRPDGRRRDARPRVSGRRGQEVELEVGLTLSTRDRVSYLEIIKNGELAQQVRLDDWAKRPAASCRRWTSTKAAGS